MSGLSPNDVVSVSATFTPTAIPTRSFGALMVAGPSNVIPLTQRFQFFTDIDAIEQEFGSTAPEFLACEEFFSQNPTPQQVYIGRWNQIASPAQLTGGVITPTTQAAQLAAINAVTAGTLSIIYGATPETLAALNFSTDTSLTMVAARINAAQTLGTCIWDSVNGQFVISSKATGASATIGFAASGALPIIGPLLFLTAATGATLSQGAAAETPLQCAAALMAASGNWYGLMFAPTNTADISSVQHQAVSALIEASNSSVPRIYGINIMDPAALNPTSTTDLAFLLSAANYERTFSQFSSTNQYAIASLYGRGFTVNFTAQNTVLTLFGKSEPGVIAETLTETQAAALEAKNCNVFVNYLNGAVIVQNGCMANGFFFDEVQGVDWFCNALQVADFNLITTTPTKIPQTDGGTIQLINASESACVQGVNNGLFAPGQWNGPAFGTIVTGQFLPAGYYVFAPPVATQAAADRQKRVAVTRQIAVCLAGAVHRTNILVNVQR